MTKMLGDCTFRDTLFDLFTFFKMFYFPITLKKYSLIFKISFSLKPLFYFIFDPFHMIFIYFEMSFN